MQTPKNKQRAHAEIQDTPPSFSIRWYLGVEPDNLPFDPQQAKNLLRRAALNPHGFQLFGLCNADTPRSLGFVRLKNAPGGMLLLHPDDAGSQQAAVLGAALDRLGCLHKLGISPKSFSGGPLPAGWEAPR